MLFHQPKNSVGGLSYNAFVYRNIFWDYHFHRNYEMIFVQEGRVKCTVGGIEETLVPGDFALCLSNEIHRYDSLGESRAFVLVFSADFVKSFDRAVAGKSGDTFKFRCRKETVAYLEKFLFSRDFSDVYRLQSCLYAVCAEYLSSVTLQQRADKKYGMMNGIAEYISENYKNDLTLSDVAKHFGYDYSYLSKIFRRNFQMSFTDYLNTFRCNEAASLLSESSLSITEIAFAAGFQSIRSFNAVFKAKYGISPKNYRK